MLATRDADFKDVPDLTLLMNELGYPTSKTEMEVRFKTILNHPDYKTIVIVCDREIVGMAGLFKGLYYEKNGMYMRILAFVVKQASRKMGIGRLLMEKAERWAREHQLNTILISSANSEARKAAHAFYTKMGYAIKSSGFIKQL